MDASAPSRQPDDLTHYRLTSLEEGNRELRTDIKDLARAVSDLVKAVAVLTERLPETAQRAEPPTPAVMGGIAAAVGGAIIGMVEAIRALTH